MARRSLAAQLARIANPAPEDVDPEAMDGLLSDDSLSSSSDNEEARAHYVDVGRSQLRDHAGNAQLAELPKYKGQRVSREALISDPTDSLIDNSDSGSDSEAMSASESSSESFSEVDADSDGDSKSDEGTSHDETSKLRRQSNSHVNGSGNASSEKEADNGQGGIAAILAGEQRAARARLIQEGKADIEKGKAVQTQLRKLDDILDIRIAVQKILNASNNGAEGKSTALLELAQKLLELRGQKADANLADLEAATEKADLELASRRDIILSRWSRKVQLQQANLKALGQSVDVQVRAALGDMERLQARTFVNRSSYTISDAKLFDDTDFYQLLLKDLIDRRMAQGNSIFKNGVRWKPAKVKKNVDTKASKGRKLRYNVQEKIQGFDAPHPHVFTWSDQQAEELYSHLLGVTLDGIDRSDSELEPEYVDEEFTLFG